MKTRILISLFTLALTLNSCDFNFSLGKVEGNGNVLLEERIVSGIINEVIASNGLEVELHEKNQQQVHVEADDNLHEFIETELKNGKLYVRATKNIVYAKSKKVIVAFSSLNAIEASSGANVNTLSPILADNLFLKSSSGGSLEINAMSKELTVQASSGSSIKISGQARSFDVKASSGSRIEAKDLVALQVNAKASSGADVTLYIENSLEAEVSSGGDIKYYGEPKIVNKNNSSSGSVRKM